MNGTVNSIALTPDCSHAYIGGSFSRVDGSAASNIADIRTYNNTMVQGWAHHASAQVNTVLRAPDGHLLVGGAFTSIKGSSRRYYVSLNLVTGKDDGYLNLHISGRYTFPGADPNRTAVYNQQLSPNGSRVLAEGTFTRVRGKARQQIFMLSLGGHGDISDWYSPEFSRFCAASHPFYVKAAAWSPDGSTVYVAATTGFHPQSWRRTFPLTGLCDAVAAFPATRRGGLAHTWVNYTGCDSLSAIAAGSGAVYAGGHERWGDNARGCNAAGPGAIASPGMGGYTPGLTGGHLLTGPAGHGLYSRGRGRGLGADDMLVTGAGLWIASENLDGTDRCGGVGGHAGICFLPYTS